ncbi:MAG: hypothetical protein OER22_06070 [Gammaproteobacteria bacterium]|nr:hypothetical protein [Gammaproteobacteria bacterium]MDH3375011.1 hypothetical protein [Gammaproteobacteria bacterium]MDH3409279.1 hypothetical protein [Gammaproteobacteria bacterium]MDH3552165.1 hypothetical protein [Gammaproteobacteria bacterium]
MRKRHWVALIATVIGGAGIAWAADIDNLSGQSCGEQSGDWHFVNNKTDGATFGTLTATFSSGAVCIVSPSKVNNSNIHFDCDGYAGALLSASTDLSGKLVLSHFSCDEPPKPPPCDPKDPKCV